MIHEFALDPATVNDWPFFKLLVAQFGIQNGRLISRFPHDWKKMAIDTCHIQGSKRTAIVEKLRSINHKLAGFNREYNKEKNWLDNAEFQQGIKPFHAIISSLHPIGIANILLPEDIDEATPLWNVQTQRIVPRRAYELACCSKTLLNISRDILFIDPYFDPIKTRFLNTLRHMISFAFALKEPRRLELHVEYDYYKEQRRETDWQEDCLRHLHPLIPEGFPMEIYRWESRPSGDKPHARYVMTELGGIGYNYGLDEWENDGQTTDVSLLDQSVYEQRWREYQKNTAAYHLINNFTVTGGKKSQAVERF